MSEEEKKIVESVEELISQINPNIPNDPLDVIEESISISTTSPPTTRGNLNNHIDRLWKDLRAVFKLVDKVGMGVAKSAEAQTTLKAALMAAILETRRQVKSTQKDVAKLRRELERESKTLKRNQEKFQKTLQSFKKMVDLYMNPPKTMGPISRQTGQPYKGIEKRN